jgi:hypothetical protein
MPMNTAPDPMDIRPGRERGAIHATSDRVPPRQTRVKKPLAFKKLESK